MAIMKLGWYHFALTKYPMYQAFQQGSLHRNFYGLYRIQNPSNDLVSAYLRSSDSWYSFAQNEKKIEDYYARLEANTKFQFIGAMC